MKELREFIYNQHDVVCNQKYGDNLPYSFHLKAVEAQGEKFIHLVKYDKEEVRRALICHDALEDARLTYNDLIELYKRLNLRSLINLDNLEALSVSVANIVYCVTDEKGKNRAERKNDKYYKELSENKLAVFVKLADLAANTLYSKLMNSSMYDKYKAEFPKFKLRLYTDEYREFFDYIENI